MKITAENMTTIAIGTKVIMNWGAYYPIEEGLVVDYKVNPATKHFPATYELVVEKENGEVHYTSNLVEKGIGVYLETVYMGV
jgi:hypothetical protein